MAKQILGRHPSNEPPIRADARKPRSKQAVADGPHVQGLALRFDGIGHATMAEYWLELVATPSATLWDVDKLLRSTWLECCGHMSAFEVRGRRFEAYPNDEYGPPAESMRAARLEVVLSPGDRGTYEYDFGSTTELTMSVGLGHGRRQTSRARVGIVARNPQPALLCGACGAIATRVCAIGCQGPPALCCKSCSTEHECGTDMMARLVNSPRTGVCGYPLEQGAEGARKWLKVG
jgi:hypothetical protein